MSIDFSLVAERLRHLFVIAFCIGVTGYFIVHGAMGDRGVLALSQLEGQVAAAKLERQHVQNERHALETRTRLLRPDSLDLDLLEERTRAMLGYTKPNEYVILFKEKK
jgi:cell division protein FtsB